jgi:hypothetical protein
MDESDDKKNARLIYPFRDDATFDIFYEGIIRAYAGETEKSIECFRKVVGLENDNPVPYMFLIMSLEFDLDSTEEERRELCKTWLDVAVKSGNSTQMTRAKMAVKYYDRSSD